MNLFGYPNQLFVYKQYLELNVFYPISGIKYDTKIKVHGNSNKGLLLPFNRFHGMTQEH